MNKKQKNRKLVKQNKRNGIINRRYSSTIKNLSKLYINKIKNYKTEKDLEERIYIQIKIANLIERLYSILDKAVKKGVIHKNTAARKKSKIIGKAPI